MTVCSYAKTELSQFMKENFEIVITNLIMPEMSGWEIGKKIKEIDSTTPVILT
ncbi:MAG: response regulator [Candidatus Marinimicrobia bacterium]|nr:response regulator [Candidatus Neomarinimicrobiota bacterium]